MGLIAFQTAELQPLGYALLHASQVSNKEHHLPPTITLIDRPTPDIEAAIRNPLIAFNKSRSAVAPDDRPLAITISEADTITGGLWGWTRYSWLFIDLLFIPETLRGTGLGTRLIAQAEAEAVTRGCHSVWLDTFEFQARGFYERLGYAVFGTLDNYPPGHQRFFLSKPLNPC